VEEVEPKARALGSLGFGGETEVKSGFEAEFTQALILFAIFLCAVSHPYWA
jgi:hypothetical protein